MTADGAGAQAPAPRRANDVCIVHDLERDVHDTAPTDCRACVPVFPMARAFACLSHTCPDCGSITHALTNDRRELIHDCP